MATVAPLTTGYVKGRFTSAVKDTSSDVDTDPDAKPLTGTITFTPSVAWILVASANPDPFTVTPAPVTVTLDENGRVHDGNGNTYIGLVATDSAAANPTGFTYRVTFALAREGFPVTREPFSIAVPAGLPAAAVDLTLASPVATSGGAVITRGPANVLTVGTVETLDPGEPATVEVVGSSPAQVLNFGIPGAESGGGAAQTWETLPDKPAVFPPSAHSHAQSDIEGLADSLANKVDAAELAAEASARDIADDALEGRIYTVESALPTKANLVDDGTGNLVVPTSEIPAIALNQPIIPVANRAAMLALTGIKVGQLVSITGTSDRGTYSLGVSGDPTVFSNWLLANVPTDVVQSVNNQQGVVVLGKSDVGLGNADNTSDANKPASDPQKAEFLSKTTDGALADGVDIALGSTAGTMLGNASTQKLAFLGATPLARQAASVDLGTILSNLGLRSAGGQYPITTIGDVATSGKLTGSGALGLGNTVVTASFTTSDTTKPVLKADATSGPITISLGNSTARDMVYFIHKSDASANAVTVTPSTTAYTLGGVVSASVVLRQKGDYAILVRNGLDTMVVATNADYVPGAESQYAALTTNFTTTSTSSDAGSLITGLVNTVVGRGRPVEVEFFLSGAYHSTAGTDLLPYISMNGDVAQGAAAFYRTLNPAPIFAGGPSMVLKVRKVLTEGTTYTFRAGIMALAAGTTTVVGATGNVTYLSTVNR